MNAALRCLAAALAIAAGCMAVAQARLGFDGEEYASVGIYIKNLSTGQVVAQNDARKALVPASVMKCVTAATALTQLGRSFQFETPAYLYGAPDSSDASRWRGNLVIEGCGDPTLESSAFESGVALSDEIAKGLRRKGISSISGRIIVAESLADAGCIPQWEIEDVGCDYGAGLHGFNYRDNVFRLWPATGETRPYVPGLRLTVIQCEDGASVVRGVDSDNIIVYGRDPKNLKWVVKTTMDNPARVFEHELASKLEKAGIKVEGGSDDDESQRVLVASCVSPLNGDILQQMMHRSHNLFAEGMLRAIEPGGTREEALDLEKKILQSLGVSTRYNKIIDGSGLSRGNRLQPVFLSDMLEAMAKGSDAGSYAGLFPVAGKSGTVKNLLAKTALAGKLALKSGSMSGVQCFVGYKLGADGSPTHTVVIMVNGYFCKYPELKRAIENYLVGVFK